MYQMIGVINSPLKKMAMNKKKKTIDK